MVMKETPSVSVIIPTLNEEKYLPLLLLSLSKVASPLQIIIVDGGSKDNTERVALESQKYFTQETTLQFIKASKKGIALQRNVGVTYATNELLLFCDADIIAPSTREYQQIISEFVRKNYVVATSKMVPMEKTAPSILLHSLAYGVQKLFVLRGKYFFGGAYLLTTLKVFLEVGGFDENLRVSEDVDYSNRASKMGSAKIFKVPIKVSTRRYEKYGYTWLFKNPLTMLRLLKNGKITNDDKNFYPFGEY